MDLGETDPRCVGRPTFISEIGTLRMRPRDECVADRVEVPRTDAGVFQLTARERGVRSHQRPKGGCRPSACRGGVEMGRKARSQRHTASGRIGASHSTGGRDPSGRTAKENDPIHQHWITKGITLRRFATAETADSPRPKTWCGDLHTRKTFPLSIERAAAENYLYSPRGDDGTRDFSTEKRLGHMEGVISRLWALFDRGYPDLSDDATRKGMALYVTTLHLRNPARLREHQIIHRQIVATYEQATKTLGPRPILEILHNGKWVSLDDDSDWEDYRYADREKLKKPFLQVLLSATREIATLLLGKRWAVLCADEPTFVLPDDPVMLLNDTKDRFGFATKGTTIFMPISSTRLLMMCDDLPGDHMYYRFQPTMRDEINSLAAENATRFVFSALPPQDLGVQLNK